MRGRTADALTRRAQARGGWEARRSAQAARRGLGRTRARGTRRLKMPHIRIPKIRALSEVARLSAAFQQRYLQRQRVRSVLLILLGAWLVWTFVLGDASVPRLLQLRRENAQLSNQVQKLREEQLGLQAEVSALKKEKQSRMVERIARDQYSMIKDGEILVKFYEEGKKRPAESH